MYFIVINSINPINLKIDWNFNSFESGGSWRKQNDSSNQVVDVPNSKRLSEIMCRNESGAVEA